MRATRRSVGGCDNGAVRNGPDVTVQPLDPSDGGMLAAWCAVIADGQREASGTVVSPTALASDIRGERPGAAKQRWSAALGDRIVGAAQAARQGDVMFVRLHVASDCRRRGAGRALLAAATDAAANAGTASMHGIVIADSAGERFAVAAGGGPLIRLVVLEQRLDEVTDAEIRRLATRLAPSFRLVHWHHGAPPELVGSYATVRPHILDAPDAHLQIADTTWDVARVRRREAELLRQGNELWVVAAVTVAPQDPAGTVVGFTEIEVPPAPGTTASQHDTVVCPAHRGRGIAPPSRRR